MNEREIESADNLETAVDEEGRNVTQQRMDEEGVEDRPVDVDWTGTRPPDEA